MRLVCPNCEAKYEVPEDAIPETGRDVQCANCGHAWFQMRPRAAAAETVVAPPAPVTPPAPAAPPAVEPAPVVEPVAVAPVEDIPPVVETVPEPVPADEGIAEAAPVEPVVAATSQDGVAAVAEAEPEIIVAEAAPVASDVIAAADEAVEAEPVAEAVPVVEEIAAGTPADTAPAAEAEAAVAEEVEEAEAPVAAAMAAPAAYAVDESVLAILREEAEREAQARRAEVAKPLETQTELGIEAAIPESRKPVEAIAPVEAAEAESDDKLANRRTRLPDVEEINSTLRPSEAAESEGAEAVPVAAEGRSSFRSGFLLVLTVAILGSAIYGAAESLSQAVPALAGPLKAYVGFVDSLRLHLDGLMQSATVAINGD